MTQLILKNSLIKILEIFRLRKGGKIKEINKLLVPNYRDKNKEKKLESDRDKLNNNEKEKKIWCDKNACHNMLYRYNLKGRNDEEA